MRTSIRNVAAVALAGFALPSGAYAAGSGVPEISIVPVALNLLLVVALIAGGAWLVRKVHGGARSRGDSLRLLAVQSLGARERIAVVAIGDQQLVVGLTPNSINTLYVPDEPLLGSQGSDGASFRERLLEHLAKVRQ